MGESRLGRFVRWHLVRLIERGPKWLDDFYTGIVNRRLSRQRALLRRPTRDHAERAKAVARERGWLTDEGWRWDR